MPHRMARPARSTWARALLPGGALTALLGAVVLLLAGTIPVSAATVAHAAEHPRTAYYLALGDSLAQGVQPATAPLPPGTTLGESIETNQGYTDDLEAHYQRAGLGSR